MAYFGSKKTLLIGLKGETGDTAGSHPNLLINSNFAINQRGQTSYTITGGKKPCVDRVLTNNSVIEPQTGGGIKINIASGQSNPYIQQVLENATSLVGKKLTLSIKIDGTIYTHTANTVVPSADSTTSYYNQSFTCGNYAVNLQLVKFKPSGASDSILLVTFTIANPNDTIINWWKLEVGDVATLYTPPLIAEELPKCQRYFQRIQSSNGYGVFCSSTANTSTSCLFNLPITTSMRTTPTISIGGNVAYFQYNNAVQTICAISGITVAALMGNGVYCNATISGATAATMGMIRANNSANAYIDLDAEMY